ncbi:hypothetical protein DFJ77DRAFT_457236 [Powellomyces hirtus]|nr:hypothetical protein DFJ77DRAFT_457236 [Powellomyces hirtus]
MPLDMFALLNSRPARVTYEKLSSEEVVAAVSPRPVPFFVTQCSGTKLDLTAAKAAQVTIERCSDNTRVEIGSIVGTVEIISCSHVSIVVRAEDRSVGTVTVDGSEDVSLQVPEGWTVYTTSCKNVFLGAGEILDDSGAGQDGNSPFRLKTVVTDGMMTTVVCNLYGDAIAPETSETPAR